MQLYLFREVRQFFTGVDNFRGSEHFSYIKLDILKNVEKVLETYNTLLSDNLLITNQKPIQYKF